jgi:zinc/manganese transport system substrate-binding protein
VRRIGLLFSLLLAVPLAGCAIGSSSTAANGRLQIVAAENFWGSIVGQIAGPDANVTSVVRNPNADPHEYEPTTADARAFAVADYVVINGIGYDAWARQLVNANPTSGRRVLDVGQLIGIAPGANPHQWYSPTAVSRVIDRVASDLASLDPSHASDYKQRAETFETATLAPYHKLIDEIRSRYGGAVIGASESVVVPLADALDLRVATPASFLAAISEGNEPAATDKVTADAQIANGTVKVFVFNAQNSTPDVQRLIDSARAHHIPIVSVTETLAPASATFQSWQTTQLRALQSALAQAEGAQ